MLIMPWAIMSKLGLDKSFIANLIGYKREIDLFAGALVVCGRGLGNSYTSADFARRFRAASNTDSWEANRAVYRSVYKLAMSHVRSTYDFIFPYI